MYLDPPFDLGRQHNGRFFIGEEGSVEIPCFDDSWGEGSESFAHFLWLRLKLAHELLAKDGTLFLHGNDHSLPLLRALMDDVFGADNALNQIVWHYTGGGRSRTAFSNKHDLILWYRKGKRHTYNIDALRQPYKESSGYARSGIRARSGKLYTPHPDGTPPDDVWDIPMLNPMASERTGYATQKPIALLERIVLAASNPGDLVADLTCGSGTTGVASVLHDRRALLCDRSPLAAAISRLRLMEFGSPLEILDAAPAFEEHLTLSLRYESNLAVEGLHVPFGSVEIPVDDHWLLIRDWALQKAESAHWDMSAALHVAPDEENGVLPRFCSLPESWGRVRLVMWDVFGRRWQGEVTREESSCVLIRTW